MTFFGTIWCLILLYAYSRKGIELAVTTLLFSMLFQCNNVISIGTITCGPQLITSFCFIVRYLFWKKGIISRKRSGIEVVLLFLVMYIIVQTCFVLGQTNVNTVLKIIQIGIYSLAFLCLGQVSKSISREYFYRTIKVITVFILVIGVMELAVDLFGIPKGNPLQYLIYNDTSGVCYYRRVTRFYSTFMEPSYCSGLIVGLLFFYIHTYSEQSYIRHKRALIVGLGAASILTLSPTAYGSVAVLLIFYVVRNPKERKVWGLAPLGVILLIIGIETGIFNEIITTKLQSKSGVAREIWNNQAFELFLKSPVYGNGYKTARASSLVYTVMAELGVIGVLILALLVLSVIVIVVRKKDRLTGGAALIVISCISASIIACPDLDLCSLWLSLYILSLSSNHEVDKIESEQEVVLSSEGIV